MSKVVMSEEQFQRLLDAILRISPIAHVCLPCNRPHVYPMYPQWYYTKINTTTTFPARTVTYDTTTANLKEG
jgi:hypothetical protein